MRSGVYRLSGYSWYCARCGDYGSDWVGADRPGQSRRNKTDAAEEYQDHIDRRHLTATRTSAARGDAP